MNGQNTQLDEDVDNWVWIDCVVINTPYSDDTENYYFDQQED